MNTLPNINKQSKHIRSAALFNAAKNTLNSAKEIPKGINFSVSRPQSLSKNPLNMSSMCLANRPWMMPTGS
jgi:hypothetical protein